MWLDEVTIEKINSLDITVLQPPTGTSYGKRAAALPLAVVPGAAAAAHTQQKLSCRRSS